MNHDNPSRDLVLPNDSFAHVLDETKGHITCYVGPSKTQLADTDKTVIFDPDSKSYRRADQREAVCAIKVAPEGWYVILKNPAKDHKQPNPGSSDSIAIDKLDVGRKVHIPGPISFALWPGQMAQVVQGHRLRTNQYLIIRVYDAEAAKANWASTIIQKTSINIKPADVDKPLLSESDESLESSDDALVKSDKIEPIEETATSILDHEVDFTVGKLMIIKGTDVSFFIPPTGIEVVKDSNNSYIREAVTLERLFYCILLDESGVKRYIRGPAVVFPKPTEIFQTHRVQNKTTRKFRAIELNTISGLYVKVIATYEEGDKRYREGEELFITGDTKPIYYRKDEHQIIRYGENEIHYAVAIPKGEARYVMDRLTGVIVNIAGPDMYLPDPRKKVIIRRHLPEHLCKLMFPGNEEVLQYNDHLNNMTGSPTDFVTDNDFAKSISHVDDLGGAFYSRGMSESSTLASTYAASSMDEPIHRGGFESRSGKIQLEASAPPAVDGIARKTTHTKPRTITLDTKFDGAIRFQIWTGYAVMVVNGVGERKVIKGPATYNLEYDEYPEIIGLSTGKPKNTDRLHKDIYLRTLNNKIADLVKVETKDLVEVSMKLSYRINFVDDSNKWFDVENYVKFLCDHLRSRLKGFAQTISLSDFYADSVNHIRNVVLGDSREDGEARSYLFSENNMEVVDVEVLAVQIQDDSIAATIHSTQQEIVTATIDATRTKELVVLKDQIAKLEAEEAKIEIHRITTKNSIAEAETASQANRSKNNNSLVLLEQDNAYKVEVKKIEDRGTLEDTEYSNRLRGEEATQIWKDLSIAGELERSDRRQQHNLEQREKELQSTYDRQGLLDNIATSENIRIEALDRIELSKRANIVDLDKLVLAAQSGATVEQLTAIQPKLVEALQAVAQVGIGRDILPSAIPLSLVEGMSTKSVLEKLFKGTSLGSVISNMTDSISSVESD